MDVIPSLAAYSLTHRNYGNIYSTWRPDSLLGNETDWVSDLAYYDCTFVCVEREGVCAHACACLLV